MNFSKKEEEDFIIELAPFIDVAFLLLIFFMVSTTFISSPGIKINLPKAKSDEIIRDKKDITIVISEKIIMFNKIVITVDDLEKRFLAFKEKYDDKALVILKADKNVTHGLVVRIMDIAKRAGFNKLGIATEPEI